MFLFDFPLKINPIFTDFTTSSRERDGLTTILLDFTRDLRQHYYSEMGHFVWDFEDK